MRAVLVERLDGPDAVVVRDVPDLAPSPTEVLIDVKAAGVSFPDLLLSSGLYQVKPPLPFTLGTEVSGVVRRAPADSQFSPGDHVVAFTGLGGFADLALADPEAVLPLPGGVSFSAGAALPMNYLTAHFALLRRGRLQHGETVLVHGAAGGVGTASVQIARAYGARAVAVVSTAAKGDVARRAGADEVVLADRFLDSVHELTDGAGVDVILDPVGGARFADSLRALAPEGRLLVVGFTAGEIPTVRVNRLLLANISVVGVAWGAFALGRPGFLQHQWQELLPFLHSGAIDPVLGSSYPVEEAGLALRELAERRATGKLTLNF